MNADRVNDQQRKQGAFAAPTSTPRPSSTPDLNPDFEALYPKAPDVPTPAIGQEEIPVIHRGRRGRPYVSSSSDLLVDWAEQKHGIDSPVPSPTNDDPSTPKPERIYNGAADPEQAEAHQEGDKDAKPTSPWFRVLRTLTPDPWGQMAAERQGILPGGEELEKDPLSHLIIAPYQTDAQLVNDINSRVSSLRRDMVNNPFNDMDDPIYEYKDDAGKVLGTSEDRIAHYRLDNGMDVTFEDFEGSKAEGSKIIVLRDGRRLNRDDLPEGEAAWEQRKAYTAFPDGTVTMRADGSVPEGMQEPFRRELGKSEPAYAAAMAKRQERYDANVREGRITPPDASADTRPEWLKTLVGTDTTRPLVGAVLGNSNPRSPWQDRAGHDVWDRPFSEGGFKPSEWAWEDALPWLVDSNLSSLPYYTPYYNTIAGASAVAPYLAGYDGSQYAPTGWGLSKLDELGMGDYPNTELSYGQRVGGAMAPLVDAAAERFSGKAIGGIPKFMRDSKLGRKFATGGLPWQVAGGAFTEGMEEVASSPWQKLQQEGARNFGRPKSWNEEKGEYDYDQDATPMERLGNTVSTAANDFGAGAVLGGMMDLYFQGRDEYKAKRDEAYRSQRTPLPEIPKAPTRADALLDEDAPNTLEQRQAR